MIKLKESWPRQNKKSFSLFFQVHVRKCLHVNWICWWCHWWAWRKIPEIWRCQKQQPCWIFLHLHIFNAFFLSVVLSHSNAKHSICLPRVYRSGHVLFCWHLKRTWPTMSELWNNTQRPASQLMESSLAISVLTLRLGLIIFRMYCECQAHNSCLTVTAACNFSQFELNSQEDLIEV